MSRGGGMDNPRFYSQADAQYQGLRRFAARSDGMSAESNEFDIEAAWLRRAQGDLPAFLEALAVRLQGALPHHVTVERKRDGLLSRTSHVARIDLRTENAGYGLALSKGVLTPTRAKVVRGVVISTSALPLAAWLAEVRAAVKDLADQTGDAADLLHDFL
jgi:hypothetical protein